MMGQRGQMAIALIVIAAIFMLAPMLTPDPPSTTIDWYVAGDPVAPRPGGNLETTGYVTVVAEDDPAHSRVSYTVGTGIECGTATIVNGTASIVVSHSLGAVPAQVVATGRDAEVAALIVSTRDSSTIGLAVPTNTTADRLVDWCAYP